MYLGNERKAFIEVARLVRITTKMESDLERLGGVGNGIYEKYDSISHKFPKDFEKRLIEVAEARNKAVHDTPEIQNKEKIFHQSEVLEKMLLWREEIERHAGEVQSIFEHQKPCEADVWHRFMAEHKETIDTLYAMEQDSRKHTFESWEQFMHEHLSEISPKIRRYRRRVKWRCLFKSPLFWGTIVLLVGIYVWQLGR